MSIGLFIDGAFISKCYPGKIDYLKLRNLVERELTDSIDEAYYFNALDDPGKATAFHKYLTTPPPFGPGFRPKIYWISRKKLFWPPQLGSHPVLHPKDPSIQFELTVQKGVDVGLAFHLVRSYYKRHWSKLALCAGDADFHEPVQSLVEGEGVDLYLVGSMAAIAPELRSHVRRIIEIDREPIVNEVRLLESEQH